MANADESLSRRIERPRSLVDLAVEQIRAAIIDGRLAFGEQVSEVGLATTFGISKTPVREALLRLKLEGLVEVHPQRGTFVFSLSAQQVRELMQFRELIESAALGEAIREDRLALKRLLEDNLAAMARCETEGRRDLIPGLDSEFHEAILKACSNPYLRASYGLIGYKFQALRSRLPEENQAVDDCQNSHAEILEAVGAGATARAQKLLREHIRHTEAAYLAASQARRNAA